MIQNKTKFLIYLNNVSEEDTTVCRNVNILLKFYNKEVLRINTDIFFTNIQARD